MKNLKKTTFKIALSIMAVLMLLLTNCKKSENTPAKGAYADIKSDTWRDDIGDDVTVEGIVVSDGDIAKIISKKELYELDGLANEDDYILLERDVALSNQIVLSLYHGKKVRVTGKLKANEDRSCITMTSLKGDRSLATVNIVDPSKLVVIDSISVIGRYTYWNFCDRYPIICNQIFIPITTKTALLYSGGIDASYAYGRYWNDLKVMYNMLLANGYTADNIRVVYKGGVGNDGDIPVHYAANNAGFDNAISYLKGRMSPLSKFFLMMNNHGGGNDTYLGTYGNSGVNDANGDDNRGGISDNTDEDYCYYNSAARFIDDSVAAKINRLPMASMIAIIKPCFSGGLIWDLRGPNRVILTSGTEFQVTYSHSSGNFGEFTYRFFSAIGKKIPDGATVVNADINSDGKISMYEAFIYIKDNDVKNEQPQYEDDNDGVGTRTPSSTGYGSNVFL